jgi:hypothetical protein
MRQKASFAFSVVRSVARGRAAGAPGGRRDMPNLLPNWSQTLPWDMGVIHLRAAGRLTWGIILLVIGMAFVFTLLRPPLRTRPFPTAVGVALFPVIIVVGLVIAKVATPIQRGVIWLTFLALIGHGLMMVATRTPRDPERRATWAECMAGSVAAFALFTLGYATVPSEWLNFANGPLGWGDNTKFVFTSHMPIFGLSFLPNYPFNFDFPALRDIVVTVIYGAVLTINVIAFVKWQTRLKVEKAEPDTGQAPVRRSRFGRPLRVKA